MQKDGFKQLDLSQLKPGMTVSKATVKIPFDPLTGTSAKGREWANVTVVLDNGIGLSAMKGETYYPFLADKELMVGDVITVGFEHVEGRGNLKDDETIGVSIKPTEYIILGYEKGERASDIPGFKESGLREEKVHTPKQPKADAGKSGGVSSVEGDEAD